MGWEVYLILGLAVIFFTSGVLFGDNLLFRRLAVLYSLSLLLISTSYLFHEHPSTLSSLLSLSGYLMFLPVFYINYRLVKSYRKSVDRMYIDPLSGVYNRLFLEEVLSPIVLDYQRLNNKYAVLFVDVDDLKQINDNFGHGMGDRLLAEVGKLLKSSLRAGKDFVVRYGGDEFIIVAEVNTCANTLNMLQRIESEVSAVQSSLGIPISLSVGFACYPEDGKDFKQLIKLADERMYNVKSRNKKPEKCI
ncbi:MAG: GGDEF domain-containing protein [Aquificaceae bacterium]|nr:GGDEF domain-containing protein [Aquificaceae bacterium]MDW8032117.1 GGDEF domain-containing protein [Aquificaceae bacterium]